MREETVKCNECKGIVDGPVYVLPTMIIRIEYRGKGEDEQMVVVRPGGVEGSKPPDFCGVPCMLKWINNKATGGINGGRT
jgi:hypothetical protein